MRWCDVWGLGSLVGSCTEFVLEPSTSLITLLSASENYSTFLSQLQRSDLVDYLNELENVTLLAPQNEAYTQKSVPRLLRSEIDRMLLDVPIWEESISGVMLYDTLSKSVNERGQELQLHVPLLLKHDNDTQTWFAENAHVVDDRYSATTNSKLLGLDSFLVDPKLPLCSYFKDSLQRSTRPREFTRFAELVSASDVCGDLNLLGGNLTVLIPADGTSDMTMFNEIEWNYLMLEEAAEDRNKYLGNFFVKGMIGGNLGEKVVKTHDLNGAPIDIVSKYAGDAISLSFTGVNSLVSTQANYLLNNGIVHYFENDLFPNTDRYHVDFTPRKYLFGLDQEDFVKEIDFKNLGHLIDDVSLKQSIFISKSSDSLVSVASEMKNQLLYHFAERLSTTEDHSHILLNSRHCKDNICQKIRLSKQTNGNWLVNDQSLTVEPIVIGSTIIYTMDEDIQLPSEFKMAVAKRKAGYARSTNLLGNLRLSGSKTILLPHTGAWEELGLVWKFLKSSPEKLEKILKSFILNDRIYTDFEGVIETTNGLGEKVIVQSYDGGLRLIYHVDNFFEIKIPTSWDNEILYESGVIHSLPEPPRHSLSQSLFPWSPTFNVSLTDILTTQNHAEFKSILEKLELGSVLEPENGYSILLPPAKSIIKSALLTWNDAKLRQFVSLHVLPSGSIEKIMTCDPDELIPTLDENLNLQCRQLSGGELMLSIAEGSDREVRVLHSGLTFPYQNQGVMVLDKLVDPDWLDSNTGIHVHLSWLALFVGFLLGVIVVLFSLCACLGAMVKNKDDGTRNDQRPDLESGNIIIEREPLVTVNEQMPLLPNEHPSRPSSSKSLGITKSVAIAQGNEEERAFSSEYSKHAKSHPVRIGSVSRPN